MTRRPRWTTPLLAGNHYDRGPQSQGHHGFGFDGPHGFAHHGAHLQRMLRRLDLTVEQREQVRGIMEQSRPQLQSIGESLRSNRDRLTAVTPDDADYAGVVAEVSQSNASLAERQTLLAARVRSDVWAVLTDDQKARAAELRLEMRDRMQRKVDAMQERLDAIQ